MGEAVGLIPLYIKACMFTKYAFSLSDLFIYSSKKLVCKLEDTYKAVDGQFFPWVGSKMVHWCVDFVDFTTESAGGRLGR